MEHGLSRESAIRDVTYGAIALGAEAGSPLANKIGMTAAYEAARARLHEASVL